MKILEVIRFVDRPVSSKARISEALSDGVEQKTVVRVFQATVALFRNKFARSPPDFLIWTAKRCLNQRFLRLNFFGDYLGASINIRSNRKRGPRFVEVVVQQL